MENSYPFPSGQERKYEIRKSKKDIQELEDGGKAALGSSYGWLDSPLQSFDESFAGVLPEGVSLQAYIERTLESRRGKAVGVEFGGVGSDLFHGFTSGFFAKSVGVTLSEHRELSTLFPSYQPFEADKKINHSVLEGDVFSSDMYLELSKLLDGEKVDLIIERMAKGLEVVPIEPYTISKILQIWYGLLREGGVMFVQTPVAFNNILQAWASKIEEESKGLIEIQFQARDLDIPHKFGSSFRLKRLAGAPKELPLLDPRTVGKYRVFFKSQD